MRTRVLIRTVAAVITIMVAQVAVGSPARAADNPGQLIVNDATELCLDGSVSQGVRLSMCNAASPYQRWTSTFLDGDSYILMNRASGTVCLDGSVTSGARMLPCNYGAWQVWESGENLQLFNAAYDDDRALDGSVSRGVRMNVTVNSRYQHWRFVTR
ncbi:hypothetical protein GCM10009557_79570 [Virgisporangium ochraceum]|uniref:Ricin B lectin domain-containing protein n=1 Tax=Virgisporangium ochraceum TaxID=65505 RepID=A0A8J3ZUM7_9ACTN|nr:ricin-type beta-trefoil lectin domain protein [Virgisporangium ochraceum]GIJ70502.1 hypothetical protein Voc01_054190 [Virgisporangium ochraceum]